jgi:hypothetical protein
MHHRRLTPSKIQNLLRFGAGQRRIAESSASMHQNQSQRKHRQWS